MIEWRDENKLNYGERQVPMYVVLWLVYGLANNTNMIKFTYPTAQRTRTKMILLELRQDMNWKRFLCKLKGYSNLLDFLASPNWPHPVLDVDFENGDWVDGGSANDDERGPYRPNHLENLLYSSPHRFVATCRGNPCPRPGKYQSNRLCSYEKVDDYMNISVLLCCWISAKELIYLEDMDETTYAHYDFRYYQIENKN